MGSAFQADCDGGQVRADRSHQVTDAFGRPEGRECTPLRATGFKNGSRTGVGVGAQTDILDCY
jgi:hypothetical protein